jgi:glycosyltransferase involved in cell wall biosynthesis
VSQSNHGPAGARNCGVRLAMSGLIAFLDHDDLWVPNKLELQHNLFCRHADALVVLGFTQVVSSKESEVEPSHLIPLAAPRLYPHFQSAVFKKDVFDRVGPLDESMRFGEDIDWFLRAWEAGARVIVHEEVVTLYRRHAGNATNRQDAAYRHLLLAIKRSLERRRNADGVRSLPDFLAGVIR